MPTFIALIRGINVGGNKKLSMADLKAACESLGYTNVRTLLNSGNVIFEAGKTSAAELEKSLPIEARVIVRTPAQLAKALERNPLKGEPNRVMIMFLERAPKNELTWDGPEKFHLDGSHVYLHYPDGGGNSKFSNTFIERRLGVAGTTRNLNTVHKLIKLSARTP